MRETIFLQFFNSVKESYFDLCNGFSDTYDLCAARGDFVWLTHESDTDKWYDENVYENRALPIDEGDVYLSAVYLNHLYQAYVWAKNYPKIRFVVGGPVAAEQCGENDAWNPIYFQLAPGMVFPSNLTITGKSVENWFGIPNFSCKWRLDVPEAVPPDFPVYLSYTLDNRCYWRKCIYCNIARHDSTLERKRETFDFEFKDMAHTGKKMIRLNTGSLTPAHIRRLFPKLPKRKDLEYRVFMRPARLETVALKEVLDRGEETFPEMMIGIGVEFPSNRMLAYMQKGFCKEEMLETFHLCGSHGIRVNGNFILGWNRLLDEDLRELEDFLEKMPSGSLEAMQMRWLFAHPFTPVHDAYEGAPIRMGPFYVGFRAKVDPAQVEKNRIAADLVESYSRKKKFRLEGMRNIRRHLAEAGRPSE